MKNSILIIIFLFISLVSSSQEEIWGYHTLSGSKGGGIVFRVDPDSSELETIHRFGHGNFYLRKLENDLLVIDNKMYGLTNDNDFIQKNIFMFNIESKVFKLLAGVENGSKLAAKDSDFIYLTKHNEGNSTTIFAYDILMDTIEPIMTIGKEYGYYMQGYWMKYSEGVYYTFMRHGGSNLKGTVIEIDIINRQANVLINFEDDWHPRGSLLMGSNQLIYGTVSTGEINEFGSIISLDPKKKEEYNVLAVFNEDIGGEPLGDIFQAEDGCFYGVCNLHGEFNDGSFYKFNPQNDSLETIYHVDDDSDAFNKHGFYGQFSKLSDTKMIGVLKSKVSSQDGKIFSFDILSHELEVLHEFQDDGITKPIGQLIKYEDRFYGVFEEDTTHLLGGVFSFDIENSQIFAEKELYHYKYAENGQNPRWLCQGENGNVYGITTYGGKENRGVVFELDYFSGAFTKKMNVADIDFPFNPNSESFAMDSAVILGVSRDWLKKTDSLGNKERFSCIYEYNYMNNILSIRKVLPDSIFSGNLIRMNAAGNLYFRRLSRFTEYDYINNELHTVNIPDSRIRDIIELTPNIYIGSSSKGGSSSGNYEFGMLFRWNKNSNETERVLDVKRLSPDGIEFAYIINELYCSNEGIIYGDYRTDTPQYKPFVFDVENDSLLETHPINYDFNSYRNNAMQETIDGAYFVQTELSIDSILGTVKIYENSTGSEVTFELESSPFYYKIDEEYESNIPCDYNLSVDLINVKIPNGRFVWTGREDANWYQNRNWYTYKNPSNNAEVLILGNRLHYPIVDTNITFGNLVINKQARLQLNPRATVTGNSIINHGEINLIANEKERASLITSDSINNMGLINYSYKSEEERYVNLGSPVKNVNAADYDSILVWKFDEQEWQPFGDSPILFIPLQAYSFYIDSSQELRFQGNLNYNDYSYISNTSSLELLSNPYSASLDWRTLELSELSHKALYKLGKDSVISAYIDGLGDARPLILPLETFCIYGNDGDYIPLKNSNRMHALDFNPDSNTSRNQLVLSIHSNDGKNKTHISFNPESTSAYNSNLDALAIKNKLNTIPQIFTFGGDEKLQINQLPDTALMDLGVSVVKDGNYILSIDKHQGFDFVVLEDLIWNKRIDLLKQDYSFDYFTSDGDYPFKLYFNEWALQPVAEADIDIYYYPESIVIRSPKQIEYASITFYDLAGRIAQQFDIEDFHYFEKPISLPVGHYVVQLRSGDLVVNRKVLVRK